MLANETTETTGIVRNGVRYVRDNRVVPRRAVLKAVASITGVDVRDLVGSTRFVRISRARQYAMWILVRHRGHSYNETGKYLHRDHTTVIHGVRKIDAELASGNERTREAIETIIAASERMIEGGRVAPPPVVIEAIEPPAARIAIAAPSVAVQAEIEPEATPGAVETSGPVASGRKVVREVVADPYAYVPFSREWWAANDLSFRRGLARAYQIEIEGAA